MRELNLKIPASPATINTVRSQSAERRPELSQRKFGPFRSIVRLCIYGIAAFLFVSLVDFLTPPLGEVGLIGKPRHVSIFVPYIPPDLEGDARTVSEGVVAISFVVEDGVAFGTGFVVKDGVIATAAHVVEDKGEAPIIVFCNERKVEATIIISMPERDVALLAADCTGPLLKYYLGELDVDLMLIVSGYNFDSDITSTGIMTSGTQFHHTASPIPTAELTTDKFPDGNDMGTKTIVRQMEDAGSPPLLAITGSIDRGNSGSPVFTYTGVVIGMAVIFDSAHNRTFIIPAESIFIAMLTADVF